MKTYIDMFETYKGLFLASHRLKNRFKKYWGVTTLDGVEVFNKQMVIWPDTESRPNAIAILKMFGMYSSVKKAKFEGITSYYLWLNPDKMTSYADISKDIAVNHLNALVPNEWFTVQVNYCDPSDATKFTGLASEAIVSYFTANYEVLKNSGYLECRGSTYAAEAIAYYALLDDANNFEVIVKNGAVVPTATTVGGISTLIAGITAEMSIRQISPMQENDKIIELMLGETNPNIKNKVGTVLNIDEDTTTDDADIPVWLNDRAGGILSSIGGFGGGKTDDLWYRGQLRTQILDSSYVNRNEFARILAGAMDTGYTKKKTSWWKKLIAIVIVIVVTYLSWGSATAEAVVGTSAWLAAFATYMGIGVLVMTAIQYMIAKSGDVGWAQYFGSLVQVVGVVSMVAGVAAFIQNIAKRGLMNVMTEAFNELTTEIASTLGIETAGAAAAAGAEAGAAAAMAAGGVTMEGGAAVATAATKSLFGKAMAFLGSKLVTIGRKIAEYAMDQRVSTAREELGDATALAEQSREELIELTDREINIGVEDIKYYTSPLKLDNLPFEVDYLYEGTKMNIGRPSFVPTGLNIIDK